MVEHTGARLVPGAQVQLVLHLRDNGTLSVDACVLSDEAGRITLDLAAVAHAVARAEPGQRATVIRRRGLLFELCETRVLEQGNARRPVVVLAAPGSWRQLARDHRAHLRIPVVGTVENEGFRRRFTGTTRDVGQRGLQFESDAPVRPGDVALLDLQLPGGRVGRVSGRVVDVEDPHLGGARSYIVRATYVSPDPGFLAELARLTG